MYTKYVCLDKNIKYVISEYLDGKWSDKLCHLENIKLFIYLFDKVKIQKIT